MYSLNIIYLAHIIPLNINSSMKKDLLIFLFGIFSIFTTYAQQTTIKGSVKDAVTFEPISQVTVTIEETKQTTKTNDLGEFKFSNNVKSTS